jgi:hypothetical protein
VIADRGVFGTQVEVQERCGGALSLLDTQQFDVSPRLLLRVTNRAQVAVVLDPDRRVFESLRNVRGQMVGDLLVQATLESVVRPVAKDPQRLVADARPVAFATGEIGLGEVERLTPRPAGQRA